MFITFFKSPHLRLLIKFLQIYFLRLCYLMCFSFTHSITTDVPYFTHDFHFRNVFFILLFYKDTHTHICSSFCFYLRLIWSTSTWKKWCWAMSSGRYFTFISPPTLYWCQKIIYHWHSLLYIHHILMAKKGNWSCLLLFFASFSYTKIPFKIDNVNTLCTASHPVICRASEITLLRCFIELPIRIYATGFVWMAFKVTLPHSWKIKFA